MLEVKLIGTFDIKCDGKPVIISSRTAQSLFAYLILNSKTAHRREKLAGMCWPDVTEEKARAYLRHELWLIRKTLASKSKLDYLTTDDIHIAFNGSAEHRLDVTALKDLSASVSIEELMQGLSLFHGELLPGFYEDWVTQEREHLQIIYEQKIARLLELLEKEKRWQEILEWSEHWISLGQASETAYRALMIAYDAMGDHARVLASYKRCVQALRELDLEPSEQTRTLAFKRTSKLNIPIPLTSFIGREKELKEVADLLSRSRLVTLTGSGGVGKTRLSVQVVAEVLDKFPDGIWFLDLAPLTDPALVPNILANMLGLREAGNTSLIDLLINYFRHRDALIIFDNCEHLIESCAQLVNSLLILCESLSVLATSREVLRVSGEIPFRVPSLELPVLDTKSTIDILKHVESIRLFVERARVAWPEFALDHQNALVVTQICQRLDGIPLAIELAAARANMLTVEQISKRLDDRFSLLTGGLRSALPRHQTLRATIDWSYELLSEKERILFRRLAVFLGGWTLEAAEEVCNGSGIESSDVLDLLSQLINKSLVVAVTSNKNKTRYRRLETVRQFARQKLIEAGEDEIAHTRHLKYFLKLSEHLEPGLHGYQHEEWSTRMLDERDNLRVALEQAAKNDIEAGLYISGRLEEVWKMLDMREGTRWLADFLQNPESKEYPRARARALRAQAWLLTWLQQFQQAHAVAAESLALCTITMDQPGEIDALCALGSAVGYLGDRTGEAKLYKKALVLSQSLGDKWRQATTLFLLGWTPGNRQSTYYWEKAESLFRELGAQFSLANTLGVLGQFNVMNDNMELAQKYLDEAELLWQSNKRADIWENVKVAKSLIALMREDYAQARSLLQEIIRISEEKGFRSNYLWTRVRLGYVVQREGNISQTREIFANTALEFQKDANTIGNANTNTIGVVFSLEGMAGLYIAINKHELAAQLIGWADATRKEINDTRPCIEQVDVDKIIAACLAKMGENAFSNAYDEGKEMTMDEAVALALEEQQ